MADRVATSTGFQQLCYLSESRHWRPRKPGFWTGKN